MKIKHLVYFCFLLNSFVSYAADENQRAICNIDRTVESLDFRTWLSAKSRAYNAIVPIEFNRNNLYLGLGSFRDVYKNIEENPSIESSQSLNLYVHTSNNTAVMLSTLKTKVNLYQKIL